MEDRRRRWPLAVTAPLAVRAPLTVRTPRAVVVVLAVVVLLAGCATPQQYADGAARTESPLPAATTPAASASPTCPPSGAVLQLDAGDAAMGLRALGVSLINCGHAPYRVDDYPRVRALDERRAPLDVRVLDGVGEIAPGIPHRDEPPKPIVLRAGERATALVVWRNKYDDTRRPPVNAPFLEMAPQAGRAAQVLAPQGGLDLGSTGRLGVSPWLVSPSAPGPGPSQPTEPPPPTSPEPPPLA